MIAPALWLLAVGCRASLVSPAPAPAEDPSAAWGELLAEVVTEDGYVDYDALEADRAPLDAYIAWVATEESLPEGSRKRLAHLLNVYNAAVLFAVLERGRPASVMEVDGWLPVDGAGFFVEQALVVGGEWRSLWQLEHEDLRGRYQDERIHAALNCGSRSCPPLGRELFSFGTLDRQLNGAMRRWLRDEDRGVRVEGDEVVVSALFDWYARDFDAWTGGKSLCAIAARYAGGATRRALQDADAQGCPHGLMPYDWSLNVAAVTE